MTHAPYVQAGCLAYLTTASYVQGGSFAYLTPAFALIGQVAQNREALGLPEDDENGVNHERFLVRARAYCSIIGGRCLCCTLRAAVLFMVGEALQADLPRHAYQ